MENEEVTPNSRRRFFRQAAAATMASAVAGFALEHVAKADETAAPAAAHQEVILPIKGDLEKIGGYTIIDVHENAESRKVIVARVDANTLAACSAICTHKGCTVEYDANSKEWVCPCHGSQFSLDGQVVHGPAKRPLEQFTAVLGVELSSPAGALKDAVPDD